MERNLRSRLLRLYPVEALREQWAGRRGQTKEELAEYVAERVPEAEIFEFSRASHGLTKQHIRIFENRGTLADLEEPLIDRDTRTFVNRTRRRIEEFYVFEVEYKAVVGPEPYRNVTLDFAWPVAIAIDGSNAILTFTILEKNVGAYLGEDVSTIRIFKDVDEDAITANLMQNLANPGILVPCDLNRGVKALWDGDQIDALHSRYKAATSTKTQDMDTDRLMKRDDPAEFRQAMRAPLFKTVFKTVSRDPYPPIFAVDPSKGQMFVSKYPKSVTEVSNVVRAILAAN